MIRNLDLSDKLIFVAVIGIPLIVCAVLIWFIRTLDDEDDN
jgi:hypothetical protein